MCTQSDVKALQTSLRSKDEIILSLKRAIKAKEADKNNPSNPAFKNTTNNRTAAASESKMVPSLGRFSPIPSFGIAKRPIRAGEQSGNGLRDFDAEEYADRVADEVMSARDAQLRALEALDTVKNHN